MKTAHPFDKQIEAVIERLARSTPYFKRTEIEREVRRQKGAMKIPPTLQQYINEHYFLSRISHILQVRDRYGIRLYENYADGSGERRWMPVRAMTLKQIEGKCDPALDPNCN